MNIRSIFVVLVLLCVSNLLNATTYYYRGGTFTTVTNWNTIPAGGGTTPANFTSGDIFVVGSSFPLTINAAWSITGQLQIGNVTAGSGTCIITTIPTVSSGIYVYANSKLSVNATSTAASPNLASVQNPTSTISFGGTVSHTIPAITYGNLTDSSTSTTSMIFSPGTTTIAGNFLQNAGTMIVANTAASYTVNVAGTFKIGGSGTTILTNIAGSNVSVTVNGIFTDSTTATTGLNFCSAVAATGSSSFQVNNNAVFATARTNFIDWGSRSVAYQNYFGITGNLTFSVTKTLTTSGSAAQIGFLFNGSGTSSSPQTITGTATWTKSSFQINSGTYVKLATALALGTTTTVISRCLVNSGGTLDVSTVKLSGGATAGTGGLILSSAATLVCANTTGLSSSSIGTIYSLSTSANYVFNGSAAQVTGTLLPASLVAPSNLTINNAAGVTLSANVTTTGTVTLQSGLLKTSTFTLTVPGTVGAISGASTTNYIFGTLAKSITGFTTLNYEVGDANYCPMQLTLSSAGTAGTIAVKSTAGIQPNTGSSGMDSAGMVNHYWTITNTGAAGPATVIPSVTYNSGDIRGGTNSSFFTQTYIGTAWLSSPLATTNTSSSAYTSTPNSGIALGSLAGTYIFGNVCSGPPSSGTITGTFAVCVGGTTTLANATTGGTWKSSNTAKATVSSSGVVTGVATGTPNPIISYTVANGCGSAPATQTITVNNIPAPAAIGGTATVCQGANTNLTDATTGGVWSSVSTSVATVNPTGTVTGISGGNSIISYTVTNMCGTTAVTKVATVNPLPSAPASITGTFTVCAGATTSLADVTTGGTWTSGTTAVATISTAGVVTGVTAGSSLISYTMTNACGSTRATQSVTVNPLPAVPVAISGSAVVCTGSNVTVTDATTGGTWTSSNTSLATVSSAGVVNGVASGNPVISYTISLGNGCGSNTVTTIATVNTVPTAPANITGTLSACVAATTSLSDATTGGNWTSSNTSIATVNASGVVTGVGAGTCTISYTLTNSCGSVSKTASVTINPLPATPVAITGTNTVCTGNVTSLSDATTGGTWSSSNTGLATVTTAGGVVTGVTAGNPVISYAISNSCGTNYATYSVSVNTIPSAPASINGTATVCVAAVTTLTESTTGGVWSSANSGIANVNSSGNVTGVANGNVNISYTLTNSCGINYSIKNVTVNPLPATPAAITGNAYIYPGITLTLSDAVSGGTWVSTNPANASISVSGVVTGVDTGTTTISYTISNGCGSNTVTLPLTVDFAPPASIYGDSVVCVGATATLGDVTTGGNWRSVNTAIATVNSVSGVVTGAAAGTTQIKYITGTHVGDTAIISVTVNPLPATPTAITGTASVCTGANTTLTESVTGGLWSSSNTSLATVTTSGVVSGILAGNPVISYTISNSCGANTVTKNVTVNTVPAAPSNITGTLSVCSTLTTTLADITTGGAWASSNLSLATVTSAGVVTGVAAGTPVISYTVTNGCGNTSATATLTVNTAPSVPAGIGGTRTVCQGATTSLTDATTGGSWTSSNSAVASINSSTGVVTGVGSGGANITYTVSNSCGSNRAAAGLTVNPLPATPASLTGTAIVCVNSSTTLTESVTGGTWSSANSGIATVTASGVVTGVASGNDSIIYSITNSCGTNISAKVVTVNPLPATPGSITGTATVCAGANTTLSNTTTGGVWSSVSTPVATISTGGVVSGVAGGTSIISYTFSNSCGSNAATTVVTVNPLPATPSSIIGTLAVCAGSNTSLTDPTTGGTWISGNLSAATINSSGVATGVAQGTAVVSYQLTNGCGNSYVTSVLTVNPLPATPASITGASAVCAGSFVTLSNSVTGGTWSSNNTGIATVNSSGKVTGVTANTTSITYTITNSCGTNIVTTNINVDTLPNVITGTFLFCKGATSTLANALTGGIWSSSNSSVASVFAGIVSGVNSGNATISYSLTNSCGTNRTTKIVTVNPSPANIAGRNAICIGDTALFTVASTGGTWASSDPTIATIDETGLVSTQGAGTFYISYTLPSGCFDTSFNTVNDIYPDNITGESEVCTSGTDTLSESTLGGYWTFDTTGGMIASVSSTGLVTAGVNSGYTTVTYTYLGCEATHDIEVDPNPVTVSLTSLINVCPGSSDQFAYTSNDMDDFDEWSWTSDNLSVATVDSIGNVTGISSGTATISFYVANGCSSNYSTSVVTVNPNPAIPEPISGSATVCVGAISTLINSVSGGTWSSSDAAIANVDGTGHVTGVSVGVAIITYNISNVCGSNIVIKSITVNPLPEIPTTISGDNTVCVGSNTILSESVTSGSWSSSDITLASVDNAGVVTGVSDGSITISFTTTNDCGTNIVTKAITVNPLPGIPDAISGDNAVCTGSAVTLSEPVLGGSWSSGSIHATVNSDGIVTGETQGTATISYTISNVCGSNTVTTAVTVNSTPAAITGNTAFCATNTTTLSNATAGGIWSADTSNHFITVVDSVNGIVQANVDSIIGFSPVVSTINYSLGSGCSSNYQLTINPNPINTIIGYSVVCVGNTVSCADSTLGGVWKVGDTSILSLDNMLHSTGISVGNTAISYSGCPGCGTCYRTLPVQVLPQFPSITGSNTLCANNTTSLSDTFSEAKWRSSNNSVATVGYNNGVVAGRTSGSATITCYYKGCSSTYSITVNPQVASIIGSGTICKDNTFSFSDATSGGTWSSSNASVATLSNNSTGATVSALATGTSTISYMFSPTCFAFKTVTVNPPISPIYDSSGLNPVCVGSKLFLTNSTTGGYWTSGTPSVAIAGSATGVVTGMSAGTAVISYIKSVCYSTKMVSVNANSLAANTGSAAVCLGSTTTLSNATTGGIWTSSNPAISGIDSNTGLLQGLSTGTSYLTYTLPATGCFKVSVSTVSNNFPNAISGSSTVCTGNATTLSETTTGGSWKSSNTAIANVTSLGSVTGITAGNVSISYTKGGCSVTKIITVNTNTVNAIAGPTAVCIGNTVTLSDASTGGLWSCNNTALVTINSSNGIVNGISAGSAIVTYRVTDNNCYAIRSLMVNGTYPGPISGNLQVCENNSTTLSNSLTGGTWTSGSISVATIGISNGVANGLVSGNTNITYTKTGCSVTGILTVNTNSLAANTGPTAVCLGNTVTLNNTNGSGTWSSANPTIASVNETSGLVSGNAVGLTQLRYTISSGCYRLSTMSVNNTYPAGISGSNSVCVGNSATLIDATTGGTWSSLTPSTATIISSTGTVSGIASGSATIQYSKAGCSVNKVISVNTNTLPAITGSTNLCLGNSTTLSNAVTGGTWSCSNYSIASIGALTGIVTSVSTGSAVVTYTGSSGCYKPVAIAVRTQPTAISGTSAICSGTPTSFSDAVSGGSWSSSNASKATVGSLTGVVTGIAAGTANITYNVAGCTPIVKAVTVSICRIVSEENSNSLTESKNVYSLYPNPSNGNITITQSITEEDTISILVINSLGHVETNESLAIIDGRGQLQLSNFAAGIYLLQFADKHGTIHSFKVIIEK